MSTVSNWDLMKVAELAARKGGDYAYENRHRRREVNRQEHHDVKLRLDEETQAVIEGFLAATYPDHAWAGEEWGEVDWDAEYLWVVDPIDGTMNYFQGIPYWCSSVAVMRRGRVVAGAVFAPELDELFAASVEDGAVCNGEHIRVSEVADLREAAICTAGLSRLVNIGDRLAGFGRVIQEAGKVRVFGAAALDLCYVACGRLDAMFEYGLHLWDIAAGSIIVQRAGGTFVEFERESSLVGAYLAGNGRVDAALRDCLGI